MSDTPVRVRIAPSPTGYLHVGVGRTAVFNWLLARHTGGTYVIRIEDTDQKRNRPELIQPILDALKWMGLESDEPEVRQSTRTDIHKEYTKKILESGHGYRCFCSPEELKAAREKARKEKGIQKYDRRCLHLSDDEIKSRVDAGDKFAIRIKVPDGESNFSDLICGDLTRNNEEIEDFIIARSDGSATYQLAVVVDDHDMGITHVIRGNDHITNTYKQIMIYHALGFDIPAFGHIPMILRPDKRKVSKRLGDKDVNEYSSEGILPEALFNYLCTLGWSSKRDNEILSIDELVEIFTTDNFSAANSIFDEEKLLAFNKEHIKRKSDHELATMVAPMLVEAGLTSKYWLETRWDYLRSIMTALRERAHRMGDFITMSGYFFSADFTYDDKAAKKHFKPEAADRLEELADRLEQLPEFSLENVEKVLTELADEREVGRAKYIHPTRLAVSGTPAGPGLFDLLVILSKPVVLERMRKAAEHIRTLSN
ncbi:MAG: glutamate--tRNA ligase [candidate division Zixibacteria bacterium]|nr:glutamate--tRNA ligase [candidate division Zixibacteria bacterium]